MDNLDANRRAYLAALATVGAYGVAGCSGDGSPGSRNTTPGTRADCTVSTATEQVTATPVSVDGRLAEADATIDLRWNARSQVSVADSSDAYTYFSSGPGEKYLVFRLEFTNTTTEPLTIGDFNVDRLVFETEDTIEEASGTIVSLDADMDSLTLKPGGTADGVKVFTIPNDATSATLHATVANFPDRARVAFDPSCDESLAIGVPQHEETL